MTVYKYMDVSLPTHERHRARLRPGHPRGGALGCDDSAVVPCRADLRRPRRAPDLGGRHARAAVLFAAYADLTGRARAPSPALAAQPRHQRGARRVVAA